MTELTWHERGRLWLRLGLRLILFLICLWTLIWLGPRLWNLFAPFLLAVPVAWLLSPIVRLLHDKFHISQKYLAVALILLVFVALGALVWGLSTSAVREIVALAGNWETLITSLQANVENFSTTFAKWADLLPQSAQATGHDLTGRLFTWLETVIPRVLSGAMDSATGMVKSLPSFAVATVVFIMAAYFLTSDYTRYRATLADKLPQSSRPLLSLVKRAASAGVGGYLRAQLIISVVVFCILLIGFLFTGQPYALLLALALAVLDFIPILGSGTVLVPWMVADLFTGEFRHCLGLVIIWGMVSLFRRISEPKILGDQTGLPPVLSLISIYAGMKVAGVLGMILGPILCMIVTDLYHAGLLEHSLADLRLAGRDIAGILSGGKEEE